MHLGSQLVVNKNSAKFLGLLLDSNLKFEEHITHLNKKLASGCYVMRTVSNELGSTAAKSVYYALIDSHLHYGIAFWGVCNNQLFQSVFVLQKRAIRYLYKAKWRDSCKPLFKEHKILTLVSIFILETVSVIHKNRLEYEINNIPYNTRQNENCLKLPIPTSNLVKDSLIYNGVKMYNKIPSDIKERNLQVFRYKLKTILSDKAYYSLNEFYDDIF